MFLTWVTLSRLVILNPSHTFKNVNKQKTDADNPTQIILIRILRSENQRLNIYKCASGDLKLAKVKNQLV